MVLHLPILQIIWQPLERIYLSVVIPVFMQDDRVQLFLKALKVNRPLDLKTQSVVTDSMLRDSFQICHYLHDSIIFQAMYTFLFFISQIIKCVTTFNAFI